MRINKYIAHSGVVSRRKADELIEAGRVKVNGIVVKEPGIEITPKDKVEVDNKPIKLEERKVYIMMNKPSGYLCTSKDERGRKTALELLGNKYKERLYTVGRLDYETEGLLIITNDGEMANRLIHPSNEVKKTYYVELDNVLTMKAIHNLESGVTIDDYKTKKATIKKIGQGTSTNKCLITIGEGKNRQVRKMFETQRLRVKYLKRLSLGELRIEDMKPGEFRELTKKELSYLKRI